MKNKKYFSIGEISKIKGVTIKALRFYDSIGLLTPSFTDPSSKYRYYSIDQFLQVDIIKASRSIGISPIDIRAVLNKKDTDELMAFFDNQKQRTAKRIIELQKTIKSINAAQATIASAKSSVTQKGVYFRDIPVRHVVTLDFNGIVQPEDALIEYAKFDKLIEDNNLINTYETGIWCRNEGNNRFIPDRIFEVVDLVESSVEDGLSTIPAGNYACVSYNRFNAQEKQSALSGYFRNTGLTPEVVLQVDLLNDVFAGDKAYFELQMLVKKNSDCRLKPSRNGVNRPIPDEQALDYLNP